MSSTVRRVLEEIDVCRVVSADGRPWIAANPKRGLISYSDFVSIIKAVCPNRQLETLYDTHLIVLLVLLALGEYRQLPHLLTSHVHDEQLPCSRDDLEPLLPEPLRELFFTKQFEFLVQPITPIEKGLSRWGKEYILPFRRRDRIPQSEGSFGTLWKMEIQRGYNFLPELSFEVGAHLQRRTPVYALKELAADPDEFDVEEFVHEASSRKWKHRNLIPLLAAFKHGDHWNMVFPLAACSLEDILRGESALQAVRGLCRFRRVFSDIASGLAAIHARPTTEPDPDRGSRFLCSLGYHGDLKPSNILICRERFVIADFGLSQFKKPTLDQYDRKDRFLSYRCPVFLRASHDRKLKAVDIDLAMMRKADVWSFGCILIEVLAFSMRGVRGVTNFRELRTTHDDLLEADYLVPSDSFHDGTRLKPVIRRWLTENFEMQPLRQGESPGPPQHLCSLLLEMLDGDPQRRPTSECLVKRFGGICAQWNGQGCQLQSMTTRLSIEQNNKENEKCLPEKEPLMLESARLDNTTDPAQDVDSFGTSTIVNIEEWRYDVSEHGSPATLCAPADCLIDSAGPRWSQRWRDLRSSVGKWVSERLEWRKVGLPHHREIIDSSPPVRSAASNEAGSLVPLQNVLIEPDSPDEEKLFVFCCFDVWRFRGGIRKECRLRQVPVPPKSTEDFKTLCMRFRKEFEALRTWRWFRWLGFLSPLTLKQIEFTKGEVYNGDHVDIFQERDRETTIPYSNPSYVFTARTRHPPLEGSCLLKYFRVPRLAMHPDDLAFIPKHRGAIPHQRGCERREIWGLYFPVTLNVALLLVILCVGLILSIVVGMTVGRFAQNSELGSGLASAVLALFSLIITGVSIIYRHMD